MDRPPRPLPATLLLVLLSGLCGPARASLAPPPLFDDDALHALLTPPPVRPPAPAQPLGRSAGALPLALRPPATPGQAAELSRRRAALLRKTDPAAALALYRDALYHAPDDTEACRGLAVLAHERGEFRLARQALETLLRRAPAGGPLQLAVLHDLGQWLLDHGEPVAARPYLDAALQLAQTDGDAPTAAQQQILTLLALGQWADAGRAVANVRTYVDAALPLARRFAAAEPDSVWHQYPLWLALIRHGDAALLVQDRTSADRDFDEALTLARRLRPHLPAGPAADSMLWTSLSKRGQMAASRQPFVPAPAAALYREALALTQSCADALPVQPECLRNRSISHEHLAQLAQQANDYAAAAAGYEQSLTLRRRLFAAQPEQPAARDDLALTLYQLGELAVQRADPQAALPYLDESLELQRPLLAARSGPAIWPLHYAGTLLMRANAAADLADLAGARRLAGQCLALVRPLAQRQPDDLDAGSTLAYCQYRLGRFERLDHHPAIARLQLQIARTQFTQLIARAPGYSDWQDALGRVHGELGEIGIDTNDDAATLRGYTDSLPIRRRLAELDPDNRWWQVQLSVSLSKLGELAMRRHDPVLARRYLEESRTRLLRVAPAAGDPDWWAQNLFVAIRELTELATGAPGPDSAARLAEDEAALLATGERFPGRTAVQQNLAAAQTALGALAERLEDPQQAARCYTDARQRLHGLLARTPGVPALEKDLAFVVLKLADVSAYRLDDADTARAAYAEYETLARGFVAREPDDQAWQHDFALSRMRQGLLALHTGDAATARARLEDACDRLLQQNTQAPDGPARADQVAVCFDKLADAARRDDAPERVRTAVRAAARLRGQTPPTDDAIDVVPVATRLQQLEEHSQRCSHAAEPADARTACTAAIELALALEREYPTRSDWPAYLGNTYGRLGRIALNQQDLDATTTAFDASLARLRSPDSDTLHDPRGDYALQLLTDLEQLALAQATRQDFDAALQASRNAHALAGALIPLHPELPLLQGNRSLDAFRIAQYLRARGDAPAADRAYADALDNARRLLDEDPPPFPLLRRQLAENLYDATTLARQLGDPARAARLIAESLPHWRQLLAQATDDVRTAELLGNSLGLQAELAHQLGDADTALAARTAARDLYRDLAAARPEQDGYRRGRVRTLYLYAETLIDLQRLDEASQSLEQALALALARSREQPDDADWQQALFVCYADLGLVAARQRHFLDARAYWSTADDLNTRLRAQHDTAERQRHAERLAQSLRWLDSVFPTRY